jgi:RNase P subunit RPR2
MKLYCNRCSKYMGNIEGTIRKKMIVYCKECNEMISFNEVPKEKLNYNKDQEWIYEFFKELQDKRF